MRYIDFKEANYTMIIQDSEDKTIQQEIPTCRGDKAVVFCGQLNKEEIDQINETGKIYLMLPYNEHVNLAIIGETVLHDDLFAKEDDG